MKTLILTFTIGLMGSPALAQGFGSLLNSTLPGPAIDWSNSVQTTTGQLPAPVVPAVQSNSTSQVSTQSDQQSTKQQSAAPRSTCPPRPKLTEAQKKTPVEVYIDQEKQLMYVKRPARSGKAPIFVTRISTGGGLKIPNGINAVGRSPYCAKTPSFKNVIIPAVKESDFDPTLCTPDEIRARATVFEQYYTRTFSDSAGNPVPMPKAIRLSGGIFLHQVPPSYSKLLGENVSGECIRMNPTVSKQLFEEILIHGAIKVTVSEPPKSHKCKAQYCDDQMLKKAQEDIAAGRIPSTRRTGSEGLFGGTEGFMSRLSCPNTQESTPEQARAVFERLAREERQAQITRSSSENTQDGQVQMRSADRTSGLN